MKVKKPSITGIIRIHHRGFGFLQPDDKEKYGVDIFIPKHLTKGSVDGDHVEILLNPESRSEKGPDGEVVAILKRGRSHVCGTIVSLLAKGESLAYVPLLADGSEMRLLAHKERKLIVGDRVVIEVLDWGSPKNEKVGKMSFYIGHISDASCDIAALIEEYNLPKAFPTKVVEEAASFGSKVTANDLDSSRCDLRDLECFTIDPETAKDFDDALSLTQDKKGNFHLGVHIADVSYYVKPGTALDKEAKQRCNSTYLPGTVVPMLPHELSSHLCSLMPNVNRLAVSVLMTLDPEGRLIDYSFTRSVIKSAKRFTYEEAKEVLDGVKKSKHAKTLFLMCDLCHRLKKLRYERGSIEFVLPGFVIKVNERGEPEKIELVEYDITHQLVEEFMLKANEVIASHLAKEGKPLTYRVHDEPNAENMRDFAELATSFGFRLSKDPTTEELQRLFDEARGSIFGEFLATSFIKSMKLANYSVQNIGHYGLGLEHYTHFTSPIRRYIDLVVHRALLNEIDPRESLEKIALHCSEKERLSAKAEFAGALLKKLRLLQATHAKEPHHHYEAVITEIKQFGIAFEVLGFLIEGFLPLSAMEEDYFVFHAKKHKLVGNHTRVEYKRGDRIALTLVSLNLITQETRWRILSAKKKRSRVR